MSAAGDLNGDGIDDVIMGARYADPNGVNLAGESYVVFGAIGFDVNLSSLDGTNGYDLNAVSEFDLSGENITLLAAWGQCN